MIKVMIVDDEYIIRKGIITSIDWASYDVKIVGEAGNGKEGLEKALVEKPDIVITDIRMPVMDGLELSALLKEKFPGIKIIILSGYDDFSYARQALKLGVSEYVLKPAGAEELIKIIVRLKNEIIEESQRIDREISSGLVISKNLPFIQSRFITSLLKGQLSRDESLFEKAELIKIDLSGPKYQVLLIDIDDFFLLVEYSSADDKELLKSSVMNIAQEVIGSSFTCTVCFSEFDYLIAILNVDKDCDKHILNTFRVLQDHVKKYLNVSITIAVGGVYGSISDIVRSYNDAISALRSKVHKGKGKIIHIADVDNVNRCFYSIYPSDQEKRIIDCLRTLDRDNVYDEIDKLFDKFVNSKTGYEQIKSICLRMIIVSIASLEEIGISIDNSYDHNFFEEIDKYETAQDIKTWLKNVYQIFIENIDEKKSQKYKGLVTEAMEYVYNHYSENIKIEDIANRIFVTPNYFSRVFREEIGETFIEWLNKFRVEKAKELKTYEIAEKVGYNNYKYFNYIFKRYANCTPSEYRGK
jgi:two-component system response regulator YesN